MASKRDYNQASSPNIETMSNSSAENSSKEQERLLPIANVSRIMKKSLPSNAKISKEAKETVQECVSEFISFITGEASDKCKREKRKTVNGDDLLWAMITLGFENYVGPLKAYLNKYREVEGEKNFMARQEDHENVSNNIVDASVSVPVFNDNGNNKVDFQDFNGGFFSLGGQIINNNNVPKSYEEISASTAGMIYGFGDHNYVSGGAYNESGGDNGNANRVLAAHLHQGIGW
ncbi:hypothetical protein TIFTF001_004219 [Ficus carica]|uniref:Transcription factor CBF/NF-Y/archaeal histone domain-containing protein n=1 Tax=Ficus carica TaxID=3494 RepID=A0AA88A3L8_FICCA|nr:hypothetical protein TIFTF001_004219 [Ficus carica]